MDQTGFNLNLKSFNLDQAHVETTFWFALILAYWRPCCGANMALVCGLLLSLIDRGPSLLTPWQHSKEGSSPTNQRSPEKLLLNKALVIGKSPGLFIQSCLLVFSDPFPC